MLSRAVWRARAADERAAQGERQGEHPRRQDGVPEAGARGVPEGKGELRRTTLRGSTGLDTRFKQDKAQGASPYIF